MRMRFRKEGKQFFFFTFCVEGRRAVLSKICKGRGTASPAPPLPPPGARGRSPRPLQGGGNAEAWVEPTPAGMRVLEWLRDVHTRNPALVASDRVVMPDHVHFVLIADFGREPGFQPLRFAHAFMEETEQAEEGSDPRLFWEPDFWVALSFSDRQLSAIRRYIRHNPLRAVWKAEHPDRFARHARVRHPVLDRSLQWSACGELTLLGSPFLFPVRLTRRRSVESQEESISEAVERARLGMVPVCGFISPTERDLQRRLRAEPRARWIRMVPHGLPPRYKPSAADARAFAAGRMLVLSSFPEEIPSTPISREHCRAMNERILRLCGPAAEPIDTSGKDGTVRAPLLPTIPTRGTP